MPHVLVYNNLIWASKAEQATKDHLGFIPTFLSADDPRPAAEQIDGNYRHGGGWAPFGKDQWRMMPNSLKFPGDPPLPLLYEVKFRDETLRVYPYGIVAIVAPDGAFEVSRLD